MTDVLRAVGNYLELRRALGFHLEREGRVLPDFARYMTRSRRSHVTTAAAVAWSTQRNGSYQSGARRLAMVRIFCRYLKTIDPRTEVPPQGLLPYRTRRAVPYLYSDDDLLALMKATKALRGRSWTPLTYSTLIGLLATTGMRLGEALGLDRADIRDDGGTLLARSRKPDKVREIPLHPSTHEALAKYARARDRRFPRSTSPSVSVYRAQRRRLGVKRRESASHVRRRRWAR